MIGRPEKSEAADYYSTYIDKVEGSDVLAVINRQLDQYSAFFSSISGEKSLHRYAPDKWSIREVLSHLNDCERVFAFRAFWFARGFDSPMASFDQNVAIAHANADQIPWASHVEEFRRVRQATLSLFTTMKPEAWMKTGIASEKKVTVRALAYIIVEHHAGIVRERYL